VLTVDASVWVAALDLGDPTHSDSRRFLEVVRDQQEQLAGPAIVLIEVACALARRTNDADRALAAVDTLRKIPVLTLFEHDAMLNDEALAIGIGRRLHGADSFYAALATRFGAPLITWDSDLSERAGGQTPTHWLDEHGR
jgi:predicted nucleic acid-binding protein